MGFMGTTPLPFGSAVVRTQDGPCPPKLKKGGRRTRLTGLMGLVEFVREAEPEIAANAMVCAVNQAAYLLKRLVERQAQDFVEKGGFTESLYEARTKGRAGNADAPECPLCGEAMRRRQEIWPGPPRSAGEASAVHAFRAPYELSDPEQAGWVGPADTSWTVAWDEDPSLDAGPPCRVVRVTARPTSRELTTLLRERRGEIQGLGYAHAGTHAERWRRAALLGDVPWAAPLEQLQVIEHYHCRLLVSSRSHGLLK